MTLRIDFGLPTNLGNVADPANPLDAANKQSSDITAYAPSQTATNLATLFLAAGVGSTTLRVNGNVMSLVPDGTRVGFADTQIYVATTATFDGATTAFTITPALQATTGAQAVGAQVFYYAAGVGQVVKSVIAGTNVAFSTVGTALTVSATGGSGNITTPNNTLVVGSSGSNTTLDVALPAEQTRIENIQKANIGWDAPATSVANASAVTNVIVTSSGTSPRLVITVSSGAATTAAALNALGVAAQTLSNAAKGGASIQHSLWNSDATGFQVFAEFPSTTTQAEVLAVFPAGTKSNAVFYGQAGVNGVFIPTTDVSTAIYTKQKNTLLGGGSTTVTANDAAQTITISSTDTAGFLYDGPAFNNVVVNSNTVTNDGTLTGSITFVDIACADAATATALAAFVNNPSAAGIYEYRFVGSTISFNISSGVVFGNVVTCNLNTPVVMNPAVPQGTVLQYWSTQPTTITDLNIGNNMTAAVGVPASGTGTLLTLNSTGGGGITQLPFDVISWTNNSGVEYISDITVAQQTVSIKALTALNATWEFTGTVTIPGFTDGKEVVGSDSLGRTLSGVYAAGSGGTNYATLTQINYERSSGFVVGTLYSMVWRQGKLAAAGIYVGDTVGGAQLASELGGTSSVSFGADVANPGRYLLSVPISYVDNEIAAKIGSAPASTYLSSGAQTVGSGFGNAGTTATFITTSYATAKAFLQTAVIGGVPPASGTGNWTLPSWPILISNIANPTSTQFATVTLIQEASATSFLSITMSGNAPYFAGFTTAQTLFFFGNPAFAFQPPPKAAIQTFTVASLNGLQGPVSLNAGTGIGISTGTNAITVTNTQAGISSSNFTSFVTEGWLNTALVPGVKTFVTTSGGVGIGCIGFGFDGDQEGNDGGYIGTTKYIGTEQSYVSPYGVGALFLVATTYTDLEVLLYTPAISFSFTTDVTATPSQFNLDNALFSKASSSAASGPELNTNLFPGFKLGSPGSDDQQLVPLKRAVLTVTGSGTSFTATVTEGIYSGITNNYTHTDTTTPYIGWLRLYSPNAINISTLTNVVRTTNNTGGIRALVALPGVGGATPSLQQVVNIGNSITNTTGNTGALLITDSVSAKTTTIDGTRVKGQSLVLDGSTSGSTTIKAAATTTSYPITLPAVQATTNTVGFTLNNTGTGNLTWGAPNLTASTKTAWVSSTYSTNANAAIGDTTVQIATNVTSFFVAGINVSFSSTGSPQYVVTASSFSGGNTTLTLLAPLTAAVPSGTLVYAATLGATNFSNINISTNLVASVANGTLSLASTASGSGSGGTQIYSTVPFKTTGGGQGFTYIEVSSLTNLSLAQVQAYFPLNSNYTINRFFGTSNLIVLTVNGAVTQSGANFRIPTTGLGTFDIFTGDEVLLIRSNSYLRFDSPLAFQPSNSAVGLLFDSTLAASTTSGVLQIAQQGATAGQQLQWNGTTWLPSSTAPVWLTGSGTPADGTGVVGNYYQDTSITPNRVWLKTQTATSPYWVRQTNLENAIQSYNGGQLSFTFARVVSLTNLTLSGTPVIDGIQTAVGDVVLAAGQTTSSASGLYTVAAGAWTRVSSPVIIQGLVVLISVGTSSGSSSYVETAPITTVGTSPQTWNIFAQNGASSLQATCLIGNTTNTSLTAASFTANGVAGTGALNLTAIAGAALISTAGSDSITVSPGSTGNLILGNTNNAGLTLSNGGGSTNASLTVTSGGAATNLNLIAKGTSAFINLQNGSAGYVQIQGAAAANPVSIGVAGNTNQAVLLSPAGTGSTFLGNTANFSGITITGNLTTTSEIVANATATNVNLSLKAKAGGFVQIGSSDSTLPGFQFGGAAAGPSQIVATSSAANIGLQIAPKGTGASIIGDGTTYTALRVLGGLTSYLNLTPQCPGANCDFVLSPLGTGNLYPIGNVLSATASQQPKILVASAKDSTALSVGAAGSFLVSNGNAGAPYWYTGAPLQSGNMSVYTAAASPGAATSAALNLTQSFNSLGLTVTGNQVTGWVANATYQIAMNFAWQPTTSVTANAYASLTSTNNILTGVGYGSGCVVASNRQASTPNGDFQPSSALGYWTPSTSTQILYCWYFVGTAATISNSTVTITRIA